MITRAFLLVIVLLFSFEAQCFYSPQGRGWGRTSGKAPAGTRLQHRSLAHRSSVSNTHLASTSGGDEKPEGRDPRLLSEIASPFRFLRLFIYGGVGAAGALGTFTAIPQLIFAIQDGGDAVQTTVTNLAIDVGAIIGAVFLYTTERSREEATVQRFAEREKRATAKLSTAESKVKEAELALLPVEIVFNVNEELKTRTVSIADLQAKGGQSVIIIAGSSSFVKDSIVDAQTVGQEIFIDNNVYVVPMVLNGLQLSEQETAASKGFSVKESILSVVSMPFVGLPTQLSVWERFIGGEIKSAELQGSKNVAKQGLVFAVDKTGKIIRRGLGSPPWNQLVEELKKKGKGTVKYQDL